MTAFRRQLRRRRRRRSGNGSGGGSCLTLFAIHTYAVTIVSCRLLIPGRRQSSSSSSCHGRGLDDGGSRWDDGEDIQSVYDPFRFSIVVFVVVILVVVVVVIPLDVTFAEGGAVWTREGVRGWVLTQFLRWQPALPVQIIEQRPVGGCKGR